MGNRYDKRFIILNFSDMCRLQEGSFICVNIDGFDEPVFLITEDGYEKFQAFLDDRDEADV